MWLELLPLVISQFEDIETRTESIGQPIQPYWTDANQGAGIALGTKQGRRRKGLAVYWSVKGKGNHQYIANRRHVALRRV